MGMLKIIYIIPYEFSRNFELIDFFYFTHHSDTSTRRRNHSNAPNAAKDSASHARWPSTKSCTWKSRRTNAPSADAASINAPISRPTSLRTPTTNRTSAPPAARCSAATVTCVAMRSRTPSATCRPRCWTSATTIATPAIRRSTTRTTTKRTRCSRWTHRRIRRWPPLLGRRRPVAPRKRPTPMICWTPATTNWTWSVPSR